MINSQFEIKSQLAKLLATENINIRHVPGAQTAGFDVKNRNLLLPVWQGISTYLYDMLVIHEVGHALDTPPVAWETAINAIAKKFYTNSQHGVTDNCRMAVKDFLNIVEDVRIDKRQKRRYPGSKNDYVHGLKELHERDFFGIKERDINAMCFADRSNIYFKGGIGLNIQFSDKEKSFLDRMSTTETFADVVALTEEIFDYAKNEEKKSDMESHPDTQEGEDDLEMEMSQDEFDEMMENAEPANGSETGPTIKIKIKDQEDSETNSEKEKQSAPEGDKNSQKKQNIKTNMKSDIGGKSDPDYVPESKTQRNAEKNSKDIILSADTNYIYLTLPEFDLKQIVVDYKVAMPRMTQSIKDSLQQYRTYNYSSNGATGQQLYDKILKELNEWRKNEKESISFMVKEFEMRKSADTYARQSIAKTGVIDTNKLHSYVYNDDIFRRHTIIPNGKNHGFVMVVDWSSSMASNLQATLKQLYSLVMFCRQVQIPFEVYLFRTGHYNEHTGKSNLKTPAKENEIQFSDFKLLNVLSSRMNLSQLNQMMDTLYLSSSFSLGLDGMNSTPLNQSILAIADVVNAFQKKYQVQILSTIILTDGGSDPANGYYSKFVLTPKRGGNKYFINDQRTKKIYPLMRDFNSAYDELTTTMVKILKDRTNSNVLGFYLHSGGLGSVSPAMLDSATAISRIAKTSWKEHKFASTTNVGYDENYVIDVSSMRTTTNTLEIAPESSRNAQIKAFTQFTARKKINRILLTRFIEKISLEKKKKV